MLTRAQLVTHLEQQNRWIYLGGPSRVRTQSSTLALVNAVGAYNGAPTNGNLLQVFVEMHQLPGPKKVRYANAIAALQASMPHPVYVTPNPFVVQPGPAQGIGVPRVGPPDDWHQTNAVMALRELHNLPSGRAIMQAIVNQIGINGKRVAVHPWNAQQTNNCYVTENADNAKTTLALALEFDQGALGAALTGALAAAGHAAGYAWLSGQIDNCPIYTIQGIPPNQPSSNTHGAGWVTAQMIQNWCTNAAVFPAPLVGQQAEDAAVIIGTLLRNSAVAGPGAHTGVRWSPTSVQFTDTNGVVQNRPPYIAMGHELIHALHNQRGDQPGHEIGTYSRVLYEYCCVGLGPWAGGLHTENALRNDAALPARLCY